MRSPFCYVVFGLIAPSIFCRAHSEDNGTSSSNSTDSGITTGALTQVTSTSLSTPLVTPTWGNGTCLSRTANYITHTLPQKCLRTDRVAADVTKGAGVDEVGASLSDYSAASSSEVLSTDDAASSTTGDSHPESTTSIGTAGETDSPLDNANFLSFEEWKRQNEAKLEQAADQGGASFARDRQRPGINNALDSLGDEGEIELDFSGFGSGASAPRQQQAAYRTAHDAASGDSTPTSHTPRSKDAGKTCKERTNYASFDCAAAVLKHNPECKSASSVLVENKDSYMLNTCSASNKFFIVELCNDILIDTVVLANYEFFSSIFRQFKVSVSDRYPVKMDKWRDLGTFEARNTREVQAFLVEHPQIWARYLRIEFLSHYGSEYYCPVSLLRVHGTTMLEEIRPQEEVAQGESTDEEIALEAEATAMPTASQEAASSTDEVGKATLQAMPPIEEVPTGTTSVGPDQIAPSTTLEDFATSDRETPGVSSLTWTVDITGVLTSVAIPVPTEMTCASNMTFPSSEEPPKAQITPGTINESRHTNKSEVSDESAALFSSKNAEQEDVVHASQNADAVTSDVETHTESVSTRPSPSSAQVLSVSSAGTTEIGSGQRESSSTAQSSSTNTARNTPATASAAAQAQPTTQESFFKSIHKRLQQLEANSTLSLQYIEEQSRILRDAFSKVEKRQISAATSFLSNLNETVMAELRGFRQSYDQLWQSTVIELEGQREQYQREMLALSTRLTLVADELMWQKRMGIVQAMLLLLCLGLVLFARTGQAGYLEVPLLQQMRNKSYTALSRGPQGWESPTGSPSPESRSPGRLLRRKLLWRSYTEPSVGTDSRPESKDGPPSLMDADVHVNVEAPTPESEAVGIFTPETDYEDVDDGLVEDTRQIHSSPPTPTGERERKRDEETVDWMGGGVGVT